MAQEYFNYSEGSQSGMFSEFVLKHQCTFPYLDQVDPITLYYHVEESIEERVPLPGFAPEKVISLESLGDIDMKTVKDVVYTDLAKEILKYLEHKRGKAYAEKKAKEHRLINLLYRMRSKVTHEMTGLGEELSAHKREGLSEPYYRSILRSYVEDGMLVRDDVCELVIPNAFIRTLLEDCIAGYLEECRKVKHAPFSHNTMTRKHILSWYNK